MTRTLVDSGPLVALLNRRDHMHDWARKAFDTVHVPAVTCDAVLTEACFLLRRVAGGPEAVLRLVTDRILASEFRIASEIDPIRTLMRRFADVPMSLADACLVRMTELEAASVVLTLDSDFRVYRRNRRQVIPTIMPA